MASRDETRLGQYASPPCFMHELDPAFAGTAAAADPQAAVDVARWRKAERKRLIDERLAIAASRRQELSQRIAARLDAETGDVAGKVVAVYWPFRGEPDLRPWMTDVAARGGATALPVVVEKGRPLVFRRWAHGEKLVKGVWNIPVPAAGAEVVPDIVVSPLVGFDAESFRLGYGGGFYDRTLAALPARPLVIGVGYAIARLATIYPQPHDIPMDRIVAEG